MVAWSDKIKLQRATEGEYVLGEYVEAKATELEIQANVQPFFFNEHLQEQSGRRNTDAIKIYSSEKILVQEGENRADVVIYDGRKYEAYQSKKYVYKGFESQSHYKTIATLVDEAKQ